MQLNTYTYQNFEPRVYVKACKASLIYTQNMQRFQTKKIHGKASQKRVEPMFKALYCCAVARLCQFIKEIHSINHKRSSLCDKDDSRL